MDINLLIKCITIVLISASLIFVVFKLKAGGIKIKTPMGELELNGMSKSKKEAKTFTGYSYITIEREFKLIMDKLTFVFLEDTLGFCIKNEFHLKELSEFNKYVADKIFYYKEKYQERINKSELLNKIIFSELLETADVDIKLIIESSFKKIYDNHCYVYNNNNNNNNNKAYSNMILYDIGIIKECLIMINKKLFIAFRQYVDLKNNI